MVLTFKQKAVRQINTMDCGPSCLAYISNYYGKKHHINQIRELCYITKRGVTLNGIAEAGRALKFLVLTGKLKTTDLIKTSSNFPCIIHWNQNHFVVLTKIKIKKNGDILYYIMDPRFGHVKLNELEFKKSWIGVNNRGVIAFFEPTEEFLNYNVKTVKKIKLRFLYSYIKPYRKKFLILILLVFFASIITFIFPFLTRALIDQGVEDNDLGLVKLILLAQLSLFLGSMVISIIRNWITLYIGTFISINLIIDFITKLVKLPMKHFDSQMIGDLNQRIIDNERIENLITSESVSTLFSIISFFVFFIVLYYYNPLILYIYFFLTAVAVLWSIIWLKKRKILDFYEFQIKAKNQDSIFEIFGGIRDLKLCQLEKIKISQWKKIQNELLEINMKILKYDQIQMSGYRFINQGKNIFVTYLSAVLVMDNLMTLGTLLSISYIIGEMNNPVNQLVDFLRKTQGAKLSFERLSEVSELEIEEKVGQINFKDIINVGGDIQIKELFFRYEGPNSKAVLENVNFVIPNRKVTAIVGHSGSGKTTLMKLLLRFYEPSSGEIMINDHNILTVSPNSIRENVGTVLQDGFIFSETIARNVATNDELINIDKLYNALKMACIFDFVDGLPLKEQTMIGTLGNDLSTGQKQRILIARAIYKNPEYLFMDEATASLDSKTEKNIHNNLQSFFKNKTVLLIAHRLSTVKNADNIIVLEKGEVKEIGSHYELIQNKGVYYDLVYNQLELSK